MLQFEAGLGWPFESFNDFKDPGIYGAFLLFKPNVTATQVVDQFQEEIDRIVRDGVPDKELERVKSLLRYAKVTSLQSSIERAKLLGQYELLDGKTEMLDQDFTNLFAVTSAQIQAATKKYLTAARRDVLIVQPAQPAPAKGGNQ